MSYDTGRRLLAIYAHPDDESFLSGGTLAKASSEGVEVTLVCATRGEVGEIADPALATPETLAQVREGELRAAARALGIGRVELLDYRDSGMAGTPDNDHPDALVNASSDEVVARLVGIIRETRPHVVLTFDPGGGYGHPDHMAMSRHTLAACRISGDAQRYPEMGEPWSPDRLFYTVFPRGRLTELAEILRSLGEDGSRYDRRIEQAWPDSDVHALVDVSGTVEAKWNAVKCHRTQQGTFSMMSRIPVERAKAFMSRECFAMAMPEPSPDTSLTDLFQGL